MCCISGFRCIYSQLGAYAPLPASPPVPPANARDPTSATAACMCGRLRRAARALTQRYDDVMAPSGLRITQFSLLRTLAREGPQRISELASLTLLDRTALSRTLEPLAAEGFVKIAAGSDARTREVSLTRAGETVLRRALPYWRQAQVEVSQQIGPQKMEALIGLLAHVEKLHPDPGARAN